LDNVNLLSKIHDEGLNKLFELFLGIIKLKKANCQSLTLKGHAQPLKVRIKIPLKFFFKLKWRL
jgi:hypothetical protein